MSAAQLQNASGKISGDKTSDVTILYEETDYKFDAAGKLQYTYRGFYRVETQAGVRDWAQVSLAWEPWYQDPSEIQARVLRPDGTFSTLDQKTVTDTPIGSNLPDTYTSTRVRKAPLPGVEIGSIVEVDLTVSDKRQYFPAGNAYRYAFGNGAPADSEKVVVELPSSTPFLDKVTNGSKVSVTRANSGNVRRIVYLLQHEPASIASDIDLTTQNTPYPMIEFSTGTSWAGVAQGYAKLADPSVSTRQVGSLLSATTGADRTATIQALVKKMHQQVRYTGVELNQAAIIPRTPEEVLQRHYGDCKDMSNLLVSLLRAKNIPADLALLSAGPGLDIDPNLPGFGRFDHAIVYVPAQGQAPALWIDATARYFKVGTLPYGDEDRYALIIAPQTTGLVKTPDPMPQGSHLIETRTFKLADLGPAQVIEASDTHGDIDALYRSWYGGTATKRTHDNLESYGQRTYLAKTLSNVHHGDGSDLSKPFDLTLTFDQARRGYTSLQDASVAIFPTSPLNRLPSWFSQKPQQLGDDATLAQKERQLRQEAQRSPTYNIHPFITEQRYRIVAPVGFTLRDLPPNQTTQLGPATLTEQYSSHSANAALVDLTFTTGKSQITAQEALDMRKAILQLYKRSAITIDFQQTGVKLLAQGKYKDAIAADKAAIVADPKSPLPHVWLAKLYLSLGVGDLARQEAAEAVKIEPNSVAALDTQGWVLEHNLQGARFTEGFDYTGAKAALQKAALIHSDDFSPRFDLAVLDEFGPRGVRYAPDSDLVDAIALYRTLIADDEKNNSSHLNRDRVGLAYDLLFRHDYDQLQKLLPDMTRDINYSALSIAGSVAENGVSKGLAVLNQLNLDANGRNNALRQAGHYLAIMGMYPQAVAVLSRISNADDQALTARQMDIYRNLHRVPLASPPVTTPESAVYAYFNLLLSGSLSPDQVTVLWSRRGFDNDAAFQHFQQTEMLQNGWVQAMAHPRGTSEIPRDLFLGATKFSTTGTDATGYRVIAHQFGGQVQNFFVIKEDGKYRIVTNMDNNRRIGVFALYCLEHNQPKMAKSILDWNRTLTEFGGGDDPLSGPIFTRFWTTTNQASGTDSQNMRVAAASLLAGSVSIEPYLHEIAAARDAASPAHRTDFDLLLAVGYLWSGQFAHAFPYADSLLSAYPDSDTAISLKARAYMYLGQVDAGKKFLAAALARKPGDPGLLRMQSQLLAASHDYAGARSSLQAIMDSGRAIAADYNGYAWLGLFDSDLGPKVTDAAQQANMMTDNSNSAILQTLASIDAAQGKAAESRQLLAKTMSAKSITAPDASIWYVLALLDEDYGLNQAAVYAYKQIDPSVDSPNPKMIDPESEYILAQRRIAALTGTKTAEKAVTPASKPSGSTL